jgi:hypothetical protein
MILWKKFSYISDLGTETFIYFQFLQWYTSKIICLIFKSIIFSMEPKIEYTNSQADRRNYTRILLK